MLRGYSLCSLICLAVILPLRALAADPSSSVSPGDLPIVPVVQLTVQPPRFLLTRKNCVGNVLLRELLRQAVLISARDELGLGTRDMVLREPFAVHNTGGATTVLIETRIWRNDQAQICLARFDGRQPTDAYSLADLQVDQSQNTCQQWIGFPISKNQLVDYPEFITKCEEASRTTYLSAIKSENVLGNFQPRPTRWVESGTIAPADAMALDCLRRLDVFSQYLALRRLHAQIAADGASTDRISALVRAYANLGQLCSGEWSQEYKTFLARSLLYAQRLVVHENAGPASLYVRAYSRAFAGLHAAALDDLNQAEKQGGQDSAPQWEPLVRGLCNYDPVPIETTLAIGPWQYRQLAAFLAADVDADDYPQEMGQDAVNRALTEFPGMFALAPLSNDPGDTNMPRPADQVVNEIPVLVAQTLKTAALPPTAQYVLNQLAPGDDSYRQLAQLRDRLNAAASRVPYETAEPSLGVLANLIEQEEMVALLHKAITLRSNGPNNGDLSKLLTDGQSILKGHLWGPYALALNLDGSSDVANMKQTLLTMKDRDPGSWVDDAVSNLSTSDADSQKITQSWQTASYLSADSLVDDSTENVVLARAANHNTEHYLSLLQKTSPHSATLMEAWLRAMPLDRVQKQKPLYERTLKKVETEFADRPSLMQAACNWCDARGDFARSFKLLQEVDQIEPSADVCERMAKTIRHLGRHEQAIGYLMRGAGMSANPSVLYDRAAYYLIEDQRFSDAMSCIQLSADSPTPRVWQLMARCYEAMGHTEDADQCMRQLALVGPPSEVEYYLWAKRLNRRDAGDICKNATLASADQGAPFQSAFFLSLADDKEQKALDALWKNISDITDAYDDAQIMILAKKLGKNAMYNRAVKQIDQESLSNSSFGVALRALASAGDVSAGMTAFDAWADSQLEDEDAMDWYSLAGRYLVAAGHVNEGKSYLVKAIRLSPRERTNYYLAWRELQKLGENPKQFLSVVASP